jgi:ankyrin repeat protein
MLTFLPSHICSNLASRTAAPLDTRQKQLPMACANLERVINAQSRAKPAQEGFETANFSRLTETARSVLQTARTVSSRTTSPISLDGYSSEARGEPFGPHEREMINHWIKQLAAIPENGPESPVKKPMEAFIYSDLPEVTTTSPNQPGLEPSIFHDGGGSSSLSHRTATSDARTGDRPISAYTEDDIDLDMIRNIIANGKTHFASNNRVQAIDCLETALNQTLDLTPPSQSKIDLAEVRATLATIYMQRFDVGTAQHHLTALLAETEPTLENMHHISTAHLQLAQCLGAQRNFEGALDEARSAVKLRARCYGKQSPQSYEAMATCSLFYYCMGRHPEADGMAKMLPAEWVTKVHHDNKQLAQGGKKLSLWPLQEQPRSERDRPSFSSERPSVHRPVLEQPSWERPTTGRRTLTTTYSNGSGNRGTDSRYSTDSGYPPSAQAPAVQLTPISLATPSPSRLDRSQSQPPMSGRPPKPAGKLPFRSGRTQPSSPRQQEVTSLDKVSINGTAMRNVSSPPGTLTNLEITALLEHAGYSGDFDPYKALEWAINYGHRGIVHQLLDGYTVARPKRRFSLGDKAGNVTHVTKQVNPNGSGKGTSPLILAIEHGQVLIARDLLARGAEPRVKGSKKVQPMMMAADKGLAEMVRLLFDSGVTVNHTGDVRAWTPWHAAASAGHLEVVQLFLDKGAVVDAEDLNGGSALKNAAMRGHLPICELLLRDHAQIDKADDTGWTALLSSVKNGHFAITQVLLHRGANVDLANNKQQTPLMIAAREGRLDEADELLKYHAATEMADDKRWTPLLAASRAGHVEIVQRLIQYGANVDAACSRGSTPLDHAIKHNHRPIQAFLKQYNGHRGSGLTEPHSQNTAFTGYAM